MIPGGTKDLDPGCAAAPNHRLRATANANAGMVNCEICGGEAPLSAMIDDGADTPSTAQGLNAELQAILNQTKRATIWQLTKAVISIALITRDYCNQLKAGTYTTKSIADLKSDVAAKYQAL